MEKFRYQKSLLAKQIIWGQKVSYIHITPSVRCFHFAAFGQKNHHGANIVKPHSHGKPTRISQRKPVGEKAGGVCRHD